MFALFIMSRIFFAGLVGGTGRSVSTLFLEAEAHGLLLTGTQIVQVFPLSYKAHSSNNYKERTEDYN